MLHCLMLHHNDTIIKIDAGITDARHHKDAGRLLQQNIYLSLYYKGSKRLCGVLL